MTDWNAHAQEMTRAKARARTHRDSLTPEEREEYDRIERTLVALPMEVVLDMTMSSLTDSIAVREHERSIELEFRREWAAKIREEFGKYHEHLADGGECGACGALQAANFMDPDYTKDGPHEGSL